MIGKTISHYKIIEKLGEGGMGVVYLADDLKLKRNVAIKFLPYDYLSNEDAKIRFIQEAQSASAIQHNNICTIHEIDETDDGQMYIVMDYYEGETLKSKLEKGKLQIEDAIKYIVQICNGLHEAHSHSIIHRDIKPANIIITNKDEVKILDFGLSKFQGHQNITKSRVTVGTLNYMSPEQIRGKTVDQRSDIWAIGVLLHQLVIGELPFEDEYDAAIMYLILNKDPISDADFNRELPEDLLKIIDKLLQKDPSNRYQSLEDLNIDLQKMDAEIISDSSADLRGPYSIISSKLSAKTIALITIAVLIIYFILNLLFIESSKPLNPVSVSIINVKDNTIDSSLGLVLSNLLSRDLSYKPLVKVLSNERRIEIQNDLNLTTRNLANAFTISNNAKVEALLATNYVELGETIRIDVEAYNTETKKLVFVSTGEVQGKENIFEMISELTEDITEKLIGVEQFGKSKNNYNFQTTTDSYSAYKLYTLGELSRYTDPIKTITLLEEAIGLDSNFILAYRELAILTSFHKDDYQQALRYAKKAMELTKDKHACEYLKSLTVESWVKNDWDKSIDYLNRQLEVEPNDIQTNIRMGYILSRYKKSFAEAIKIFENVVRLDPDNYSGQLGAMYNYKGHAHLYSGHFSKAIESFDLATKYSPNKPAPLQNLASTYSFNGEHAKAISICKEVINEYPNYYPTYAELAGTYLKIGKVKNAFLMYLEYLKNTPPRISDIEHVCALEILLQKNDSAIEDSEMFAFLFSDSSSVKCYWIKGIYMLEKNNDITAAEKQIMLIEKIMSQPADLEKIACYHHLKGMIEIKKGHFESGLQNLKIAQNISPRNFIFFKKEYIGALAQADKIETALKLAAEINSYYKNDPSLLMLIGDCYIELEDKIKGLRNYNLAKDVWAEADVDFNPAKKLSIKISKLSG